MEATLNMAAQKPHLPEPYTLDLWHRLSLWLISHRLRCRPRRTSLITPYCCPVSGIFSRRIPHYGLRRIAVDQRTQIKRMLQAANLVLDSKQHFAVFRIDDVLEPILMLIALLDD